jgi:2-polyprenyl-3-methyl-5-hydroxy-6-metoxy-1,4-benzoquinol methylase
MNGRVIRPEWLDEMEPHETGRPLRELVLINRFLGGHGVLLRTMAALAIPAVERFTFLDVGSATGDMGRCVREQYPHAQVTSLDHRLLHLQGAGKPCVCGDAFAMPFRPGSFDFVHCSLFLHHFQDSEVVSLLRSFGAIARRAVIVSDLERHPLPYFFMPATRWLFRWSRASMHDGPISVEAAFHAKELRALAEAAGLVNVDVQRHRPAFRVSMIAETRAISPPPLQKCSDYS